MIIPNDAMPPGIATVITDLDLGWVLCRK